MSDSKLGYYILEVTDEDLEIAGAWLAKISVAEEESIDEEGEVYVSRKLVFELIRKLEDENDILKLGFEVSKLPWLRLDNKGRWRTN